MQKVMGLITVLLVAPALALAGAQDPRLGQSRDAILEMGSQKWVEFYMKTTGENNEVGVDMASGVFADCLKERNGEELAKLQPLDRTRLEKYAGYIQTWRVATIEIAQAQAGGGTMYDHAIRRSRIAQEQLMSDLIGLSSRPLVESTLERLLSIQDSIGKVRKRLGEKARISPSERAEMPKHGVDPKRIDAACLKAGRAYDAIANMMPRERQEECVAILDAFWDWLTMFDEPRD